MNIEQTNSMLRLLTEIRDRLPVASAAAVTLAPVVTGIPWYDETPTRPTEKSGKASMPEAVALGHRQALAAVLSYLDGWIETARENHDAMEHRYENVGEECWRQFHAGDIRHMINGAARELGIAEFPLPKNAPEDRKITRRKP